MSTVGNNKNEKKKSEDKAVKSLRELASVPFNKQCCDCNQKGPTYINITMGTFVCTTCSGILRGLNPPHRVKSINMATFTADEIDFLKTRGNHYCQLVYMSLFDSTTGVQPDSRDSEKLRDFLTQKYERKRWYSAPNEAIINQIKNENESLTSQLANSVANTTNKLKLSSNSNSHSSATINNHLTQQKQTQHQNLHINNNNNNNKQASPSSASNHSSNDLFASFDAFSSSSSSSFSTVQPPSAQPVTTNGNNMTNFANFDLFTVNSSFSNANSQPTITPIQPQVQQQQQQLNFFTNNSTSQNNNNDKYAVFAELDSIFQPASTAPASNSNNNMTSLPPMQANQSTNPFASIQQQSTQSTINTSFMQQQVPQQQNYFLNSLQTPTPQQAAMPPFNYFAQSTQPPNNLYSQPNMALSFPNQQTSTNNINPFISIAKQQSQIQKPKLNSTNPFL